MVKPLDDIPPLIDHIGWRVWRLARIWKAAFEAEMEKLGHGWMTQTQGELVGQLRQGGVPQADLVRRLGVSKQAVQQQVDALVAAGVVERVTSAGDRRARVIRLTAEGKAALADSNAVKQRIERQYRTLLGPERFDALSADLDALFEGLRDSA